MTTNGLIRINPLRWPYSVAMLAMDEPSRSISNDPLDEDLAYYNCFRIQPTVPEIEDPENYKAVEVQPLLNGPPFYQRWEIIEMTNEEKRQYYRANHPPRWLEFVANLPSSVNNMLTAAIGQDALTALKIPAGMLEAKNGDDRLFLQAWNTAKAANLVNEQLAEEIKNLATYYDLPDSFVEGL